MTVVEERLKQYSEELGCNSLTLEELIDSHRNMRKARLEAGAAATAALEEGRERGREEAKAYALENDWFSRSQLKAMTLGELANKLTDLGW